MTGLPNASPPSSAPTAPSGPGYDRARTQWLGESLVGGGAAQSIPYQQAVADLRAGETTDTGVRTGYPAAIAALDGLESLPDANATPAQAAEYQAWTTQLDRFFGIPGSGQGVSCLNGMTAATKAAAIAWSQEPVGTASGIALPPLRQAIGDLEQAAGDQCYGAAIDDLEALQTATPAQVAATSPTAGPQSQATMLVGGRVIYLNIFFGRDRGLGPNWEGVLNRPG